ncbi:MAG: hypothetical protein U0U67_17875 [Chitinophagales bacterium]
MNNKFIINNTLRFVFLIGLQLLLLNELPFGRVYIMIYPLFILLLPVFTPRIAVLLLAFFTGLMVDAFSNGGGLHTATLLLIGYLRSFILDTFQPKSGWDKLDEPTLSQQGVTWFFYYTLILFLIHHVIYFSLELLSISNFVTTFFKSIFSLISSLSVVWLISLFFTRKSKS